MQARRDMLASETRIIAFATGDEIQLAMPRRDWAQLEAVASSKGVTVADVIGEAIRLHFSAVRP
jgi:hypothetical protein